MNKTYLETPPSLVIIISHQVDSSMFIVDLDTDRYRYVYLVTSLHTWFHDTGMTLAIQKISQICN